MSLKLLGGPGVFLHSPSAQHPPLKRRYGDLDFAASSRQRKQLGALFTTLGYEANERFNTLQGDRRLFITFFDSREQIDAAEQAFEQMGDEISEEVRGRRLSVDVYEVVFDDQL